MSDFVDWKGPFNKRLDEFYKDEYVYNRTEGMGTYFMVYNDEKDSHCFRTPGYTAGWVDLDKNGIVTKVHFNDMRKDLHQFTKTPRELEKIFNDEFAGKPLELTEKMW